MQERSKQCIGTVRRLAQVISLAYETKLWEQNVLGEDSPDKLRDTVLYLIGVNCGLRASDEHYALRRPRGCIPSQFSFEINSLGQRCLVYREDMVTKTNRGDIKDMKKECKVIWIKPNVNWVRCPVRIIEKYLNLISYGGSKGNLYVQSLKKPCPSCWFSTIPVGINTLRKTVGKILRNAGLDGYFTNHSLRRICATCLFQAGASEKLMKEMTGHISDSVLKYQVTSDEQKMKVSEIIQGAGPEIKLSQAPAIKIVEIPLIPNSKMHSK